MSDDWDKEGAPLFEQARAELKDDVVPPAALARAKAGLRERLEAGPRSSLAPKFAFAGAFALLAIAFVVWKRSDLAGGPRVLVASGTIGTLGVGDEVPPASVLSTTEPASLALGPSNVVELVPGARLRVTSSSDLALLEGKATFRITQGPFSLAAGDSTLEVVSAVFAVAAHTSIVNFSVSEGVVRVVRGGETSEVRAGGARSSSTRPDLLPPEVPVPAAAEHLTRLEQAQELTRAGKLDAARGIYLALAREDAPIAELALYHLAHLEAQRAKRPREALEALDELLRRFPNGSLAPEAKLSRIEALHALGVDAGR